jgi:pSer/pThr/pTyr-binding forkhead associated (FHA) protein
MILESMTNSSSKTIHVINFSESDEIRVGRGSQCEVRITDVSVSRHHSTIDLINYYDQNGTISTFVSVSDEQSKFGTLVFVRKPIKL